VLLLLSKKRPLQRCCDDRVLIIDDTIEPIDFALHQNKSRRHEIENFTKALHHKSNAYKRRKEELESKNLLSL